MKILDMLVEMVRVVRQLGGKVAQHDRDGAEMKRASTSAALNASEGVYAKAEKRRSRLEDAVNSARETLMAFAASGGVRAPAAGRGCGRHARGGSGDSGALAARLPPMSG